MTINYYALHSHMKNSGVKFVINNIFECLKKYSTAKLNMIYSEKSGKYAYPGVTSINVPSIDYNDNTADYEKKSKEIAKDIKSNLNFRRPCVLHCHNVNLMKNTYLGGAIQILSDELGPKIKIIMQVHDFAEDSRPALVKKIKKSEMAYPTGKNIVYCTINSRDQKLLKKIGIKAHLFPNNLDIDFLTMKPKVEGLKERLEKYAEENGYKFSKNKKILLSPIKIIKRKNVIETLLILNNLNKIENKWQLLITLDANSKEDKEYSDLIKTYIKKKKLPVTIGFGFDFISPDSNRTEKYPYNLIDLFNISDALITTSMKEGFGMSYLEGWVANKPVVGRRLGYIFKDFEKNGLNFKHFYKKINCHGEDFKDFKPKEQIKIIEKIKVPNKILKFILKPSEKVILKNKEKILEEYSLKKYYAKLQKMIYSKGKKHKVCNKRIVKYFEKNN